MPLSPTEQAVYKTLRTQILVAEVQFQAGGYIDQLGNGIGAYGLFPEMSGMYPVGDRKETLNYLPDFKATEPVVGGYHYKIFLPASISTALTSVVDGKRPLLDANKDADAIALQSHYWICYAWPVDGKERVFTINQSGNIFYRAPAAQPPVWNDLMGGGDWKADVSAPTWVQVPIQH